MSIPQPPEAILPQYCSDCTTVSFHIRGIGDLEVQRRNVQMMHSKILETLRDGDFMFICPYCNETMVFYDNEEA